MKAMWLALILVTTGLAGCATPAEPDETNDGTNETSELDCAPPETAPEGVTEELDGPVAVMDTNHGTIVLLLHCEQTPQTVQNFGHLAEDGFYDEVKFHRVIGPGGSFPNGFMIQAGDPLTKNDSAEERWGSGGPGYTILDEFACEDGTTTNEWSGYREASDQCDDHGGFALSHDEAGVLSMANTGQARTGGSQWFITLDATPHLDGTHAVFGKVVDGMDVVREIGDVETDGQDRPVEPVIIESLTIEGELPGVELETFPR